MSNGRLYHPGRSSTQSNIINFLNYNVHYHLGTAHSISLCALLFSLFSLPDFSIFWGWQHYSSSSVMLQYQYRRHIILIVDFKII